jgi:hypothetical protein
MLVARFSGETFAPLRRHPPRWSFRFIKSLLGKEEKAEKKQAASVLVPS